MAKSNKVAITEIEMWSLEEQIYQIFLGKGLRATYGNRIDLRELADELIFALDFVNDNNPLQLIVLNTLPELTGEDGVPAIDLVNYFGLDDYVVESVLNG